MEPKIYFAAKSSKETAGVLLQKAQSFFNVLRANAYLEKLNKMWRAYHGAYGNDLGFGHQIDFVGEQGELVSLPVNHFRNLAQHIYVMITSNRPVLEARANNTDYKSLAQTYLANSVLDYYMRERHLEDVLKKAVEYAIVLGAGFIKLEWNATSGEAVDMDDETGEIVYEGDIVGSNLSPFDVIVDGTKESWDHDWIMVRSFQNRHNLIAKYPELADRIKGLPSKSDSAVYRLAVWSNDETDDIPVYEFYHRKTEAIPEGRYMLFVADDIVLLDTKLPYPNIPIYRISPSDILGTPYGYTPMFDVFPIQEGINSLYSTIMTNNNAFGVQNLFVPRGADININSLEGGLNVIEGNARPEPLNLTQTPPELFKFLEMLIQASETVSGVNSVARGNPEPSLRSGNALALVQAMALQFISGLQQSYVKLIEDVGSGVISMLQLFASTPRVMALVGKTKRPLLTEFSGEKISNIKRVTVDVGNPLARTIAGRAQMSEQMLQMGLIKSPEQYFQVLNTGRLDSTFEGEMSELLLIKSENEKLLEGLDVIVSPMDSHRLHMLEHKAVLADPDLRQNQLLVKNVMDHIEKHLDSLRNTDPDLLALIGEQPLPPAGATQAIPPGQAGPSNQMVSTGGMIQSGEEITGPSGTEKMPEVPTPPAPFENLPVVASDLIPQ